MGKVSSSRARLAGIFGGLDYLRATRAERTSLGRQELSRCRSEPTPLAGLGGITSLMARKNKLQMEGALEGAIAAGEGRIDALGEF